MFGLRATPKPRTIERDTLAFSLADGRSVQIARVRDPRVKRLRLSVDLRGVRLTVPVRASAKAADAFLLAHREWLAAALARRGETPAGLQPQATATLPLRGIEVAVHWHAARRVHVEAADGAIAFHVPDGASDATLRGALRDFYAAQARADVGRWLPRYLDGLPRAPSRLRLRAMSTLWGSMTRDGALTLDLALVLGTPAAFEYVLVHELCHLVHMDHSRAFWREVEARCPDWRMQRAYFRGEGMMLKPRLHALCGAG